jgi:uncharacterized protein
VWVTAKADHVRLAVKRKSFARALKKEVKVAADLADMIEAALVLSLRQALALANKAGHVVCGFGKVEEALSIERVVALLHASNAAEDGKRKLAAVLRRRFRNTASDILVVQDFSSEALGTLLGRADVTHAALLAGTGSAAFLTALQRLHAYRGEETVLENSSQDDKSDLEPDTQVL